MNTGQTKTEVGTKVHPGTGVWPAAAVALLAASAAVIPLSDPDLWWHLAGGRLILEKGFPLANSFSHTFPDYPWRHTQWLFDVILRGWEIVGGVPSIVIFQALLVGLAFFFAADTVRRRHGRLPLFPLLFFAILAVLASRGRFVPRPHLVSILGLAVLLNLWERQPRRLPVWVGALGLLWANCHAGVVLGIPVIGAFATASLLRREGKNAVRALLCLAAFVAGSAANPNFLYPYAYLLENWSARGVVPLVEYRRARLSADPLFFAYSILTAAALPFRLRRKDYLSPILAAGFFVLAVSVVRFIPKFVVVAFPGTAVTAAELWDRGRNSTRARVPAALAAGALLLAALVLASFGYRRVRVTQPVGWGVNEVLVPSGAADFVEEAGLGGRMYNDFGQGGYLAWRFFPRRLVFQDGRVQTYPLSFFREILGSMTREQWGRLMDKHGVEYAFVERRPDLASQVDFGSLFEALGWNLVYLDGISYVFVKPGTENDAITRELSLRPLSAGDSVESLFEKAGRDPAVVAAALRRIDPGRLLLATDFYRFGSAAFRAGEPALCETFFLRGIALFPSDPVLRYNLAMAYLRLGRYEEGRRQLLETSRVAGDSQLGRRAEERLRELPAPR